MQPCPAPCVSRGGGGDLPERSHRVRCDAPGPRAHNRASVYTGFFGSPVQGARQVRASVCPRRSGGDRHSGDRPPHYALPYQSCGRRRLSGELPAGHIHDARRFDVRLCLAAVLSLPCIRAGREGAVCAGAHVLCCWDDSGIPCCVNVHRRCHQDADFRKVHHSS